MLLMLDYITLDLTKQLYNDIVHLMESGLM